MQLMRTTATSVLAAACSLASVSAAASLTGAPLSDDKLAADGPVPVPGGDRQRGAYPQPFAGWQLQRIRNKRTSLVWDGGVFCYAGLRPKK